jgi:hypothetical protein
VEALEERAVPSTISWLKDVSGNWDTAANWAGGKVPTASDVAVISFGNITVTHSASTADAVQRLISEAAINITGGSLTIGDATLTTATTSHLDNTLSISGNGTLTLDDLTLSGKGMIQNAATFNINSGTLNVPVQNNAGVLNADIATFNGPVPFVNGPSATLQAPPPGQNVGGSISFATGFTNQGTINLGTLGGNGGQINLANGGTLVNAPGATINLALLDDDGTPNALNGGLKNQGIINVAGNSTIGRTGATVINRGAINLTSESLTFVNSTVDNLVSLNIGTGLSVTVSGGTFTENGRQTGAGTLVLSGTTANFNGAVSTAATPLMIENSTFNSTGTLTNDATLDITGSTINAALVNKGTLTAGLLGTPVGSTATLNGAFTNAAGATVTISGPESLIIAQGFTNDGTVTLANPSFASTGATLTVSSGTLTNAADGTIATTSGGGSGTDSVNATLNNQGTIRIGQGTTLTGSMTSSGTLQVQTGDLAVHLTGTSPTFINTGTLIVAGAQGLDVEGGDVTNAGIVTLGSSATVQVSGGYTQTDGLTNLRGGILTVGTQVDILRGTLEGPGTINGNLMNAARVEVGALGTAGTLTVVGNYTQTSAGDLTVQVGGTQAGSGFDQLNVTGQATLAGTLTVNLIHGFVPKTGATFPVLTFASESGSFATVNGTGSADFTVRVEPTDVTLVGK